MMRRLLAAILVASPAWLVAIQQPARDAAPAPAVGSASVSGTVITAETPGAPVRRARVTLQDPEGKQGRTTVSDDQGRFVFDRVPSGRFMLSAMKPGYVKTTLGATRPGGVGVPLAIAGGQRVTAPALRLLHGSVITGTLRDQRGRPVSGLIVHASQWGFGSGSRTLVQVPVEPSVTDDRGIYRIYGLAPGEYFVLTNAPTSASSAPLRRTTAEDLMRARQLTQPGRAGTLAVAAPPKATLTPRTVQYAPTYYPGVASPAEALPVRVGPGEERTGIDLPLLLVPTARLSGVIVDGAGRPGQSLRVWMQPVKRTGASESIRISASADGKFSAPAVVSGTYRIEVRGAVDIPGSPSAPPAGRGGAAVRLTHWARLDVTVDGTDLTNLVITLQPARSVSGRVQFEGGDAPAGGSNGINLWDADVDTWYESLGARISPDGSFTIEGVAPGRYRIGGTAPVGWMLKSIRGDSGPSVDYADVPLDVSPDGNVSGLVVTYTKLTTELSGTLQDALGRPAGAYAIVAFTTDRARWVPNSRRIQSVRPASDGAFTIKNLPAGDYFLAAVTDVEDGQWFDTGFLSSLVDASVKVTLGEGETKTQSIRIIR